MEFPFNNDWILSQLTDHCKDFVIEKGSDAINNIAIKNVGKNGFLASIFLIIVEFSAGSNFEVIVKLCGRVLGDSDEPSFNDFFLNGLHNRECLFYEILAPFLPIPIPKTYSFGTSISAKVCGFILMESLIGRGESFHFSQSLTLGQMLELAGFVAQLQSHAMLLKDQSWIEEFGQATFDMKAQIEVILSAFKRLKKIRNGELKTEAEILASLVNKNFTEFSQYKLHQKLQIPPVLAHGDLLSTNVMWKTENGQISDKIERVFDFQGAHAGQPAWDLARFLVRCTDANLRVRHSEQVLRKYYATLEAILSDKGRVTPFTFEQIKECYDYAFVNQAIQFGCFLVFQKENLDVCEKENFEFLETKFEKMFARGREALKEAVKMVNSLKCE